jgi:hypothetical protein
MGVEHKEINARHITARHRRAMAPNHDSRRNPAQSDVAFDMGRLR